MIIGELLALFGTSGIAAGMLLILFASFIPSKTLETIADIIATPLLLISFALDILGMIICLWATILGA